jgi:hypothetical protein
MPTIEMPESKEIARLKTRAEKLFSAIVKNATLESTSSMKIGWNAYRLKSENLLGVLGFEDEKAAIQASGVCEATWYATIKVAGAFKDVPEDVFCRMKLSNAKVAMDLPEVKRQDSYWLRMAETLSMKDFADKVDEELSGKARVSDSKERPAKLTLDMPAGRKVAVEKGLREYGKAIGVEDTGQALELLLAESNGGGVGLIEAINTALDHIKWCKDTMHSGLSADECLIQIEQSLDQMVADFQKALEGATRHEEAA